MIKKIGIAGVCSLFAWNASAAESLYAEELPLVWSSIITLSGGAAWATAGQNQYLYPVPLPNYQYYTYLSDTSTAGTGEIFFGLQRIVYPNTIGELGLGVAGVTDLKVAGFANVDGIPDVYGYQYKVNHARIDLKGRLIASNFGMVQPYVSASLGAAFNNSHDYLPTAYYPVLFEPYWLQSNTTVAFTYSLGAGIQTMLTPHWQVGAGYQFADLGKSYLNGNGDTLFKGLRLTHLYTNEALLSVSYIFTN